MAEQYEVIAKVVSQRGKCVAGHKEGDEFRIGDLTPAGMCSYAFNVIHPFAQVLQFGGSFPWEKNPDRATVACPDAENPVVIELRRADPAPRS